MLVEEQKMFKIFVRLIPLKFTGALEEDSYELFVFLQERLHNRGLAKSHGVDCTTFQIIGVAKKWWREF